ncbi:MULTISPECIES: DUF1090 domain-containing protein [unclassified Gilliamella]|uniref:DUF1090 domain-containing protein n=1 Tax=unclassified Gilliamella TaxID=2685620 RepID=UPI00080E3C10|nr:DUF1090 domain-containing protein [Gilliamella apicola]OCG18801.1 hypothetical protein A9G23_10390 [Gilliamella apicola]OCG20827.1 hypothetical protein A9G22_10440 [Gilliamella apicola]
MESVIRVMTKVSIITLASLLSFGAYASNQTEGLTCENKKQAIETQIDYAKKHNNAHRVKGLEKALHDVNKHCSNDDLEAKYKKNVSDKSNKVAERTQALAKAKAKGNEHKIAKQQAKLADAEKELNEAKAELAKFYQELKLK